MVTLKLFEYEYMMLRFNKLQESIYLIVIIEVTIEDDDIVGYSYMVD